MSKIAPFSNPPVPNGTGRLNSKWKRILFFFHKRVFLSRLEGILTAAAGHEGNALPSGNYQYQVLSARADELCEQFAQRWGLDRDLLRARIPGLTKLAGLSIPPPTKDYVQLACFGMIVVPLALFVLGILAGLASVGFHLVGGR